MTDDTQIALIDGDSADLRQLQAQANSLTDRQREVMELVTAGLTNKDIARHLQISARTVEYHRAWVMVRMQARTVVDLIRKARQLKFGRC
jgi:two-component system response regulator FixJ